MPVWIVKGARKDDGAEVSYEVEAETEVGARQRANDDGVLVEAIRRLSAPPVMPVPAQSVVYMQPAAPSGGCPKCGGHLATITERQTSIIRLLLGIILFIIGISLTLTIIGALIGIPLILIGLACGSRRVTVSRCVNCRRVVR
jgi:hypothetical protein